MEVSHEIEIMFNQDCREKKRTSHSATKKPHGGRMRSAFDILKKDSKRCYTESSKVEVYNMFEQEIVNFTQFKNFNTDRQKELIEIYREKFSAKEIQKKWKISTVKYYSILNKLGISTRKYKNKQSITQAKAVEEQVKALDQVSPSIEAVESPVSPSCELPLAHPVMIKQEPMKDDLSGLGLQIKMDGKFQGKIFGEKLTKLLALLQNDNSNYEIKLEIVETA